MRGGFEGGFPMLEGGFQIPEAVMGMREQVAETLAIVTAPPISTPACPRLTHPLRQSPTLLPSNFVRPQYRRAKR